MRLLETIGYNDKIKVIALIGAGGKTTTMYRIASCLNKIGKKVICTTTKHISSACPCTSPAKARGTNPTTPSSGSGLQKTA